MRIEFCIALLASSALHAGLIAVTADSPASRDSVRAVAAAPRVIYARLESIERPGESTIAAQPLPVRPALRGHATRASYAQKPRTRAGDPLRFYPPEAIRNGIEGEAVLMLRFGTNGALVDAQIAKSSGHAILDEAALRAARATQHLASGPREILFPVTFALR